MWYWTNEVHWSMNLMQSFSSDKFMRTRSTHSNCVSPSSMLWCSGQCFFLLLLLCMFVFTVLLGQCHCDKSVVVVLLIFLFIFIVLLSFILIPDICHQKTLKLLHLMTESLFLNNLWRVIYKYLINNKPLCLYRSHSVRHLSFYTAHMKGLPTVTVALNL